VDYALVCVVVPAWNVFDVNYFCRLARLGIDRFFNAIVKMRAVFNWPNVVSPVIAD
jgi:hypothetical protein